MNTLAALISFLFYVFDLVIFVLVVQAVISWLLVFNVISMRSNAVRQIAYGLERLTNPLLRPIRRILPDMGGIDLSPMALILLIILAEKLLTGVLLDAGLAG